MKLEVTGQDIPMKECLITHKKVKYGKVPGHDTIKTELITFLHGGRICIYQHRFELKKKLSRV